MLSPLVAENIFLPTGARATVMVQAGDAGTITFSESSGGNTFYLDGKDLICPLFAFDMKTPQPPAVGRC